MTLKDTITTDMKTAMRAGEKSKLMTIRLMLAAIQQQAVDTRSEPGDDDVLLILDKMVKQRRDSIQQFTAAGRDELATKEQDEIKIIQNYLPEQLGEAEIKQLIAETISTTGAKSMQDMGKVMGQLKPKLQGRADMGAVSGLVKAGLQ